MCLKISFGRDNANVQIKCTRPACWWLLMCTDYGMTTWDSTTSLKTNFDTGIFLIIGYLSHACAPIHKVHTDHKFSGDLFRRLTLENLCIKTKWKWKSLHSVDDDLNKWQADVNVLDALQTSLFAIQIGHFK